ANFRSLRRVHNHFHCHLCHTDYEATLDDYIAVTFTVQPSVRRIRFHDPESLPLAEYVFTYRGTLDGVTDDGTPFMEMIRSGVRGLARVPPGRSERLAFDAAPGMLLGTVIDSDASFAVTVVGEQSAEAQAMRFAIRANALEPNGGSMTPGPVVIEALNETDDTAIFGVLQVPAGAKPHGAPAFRPFLSGKRLLMTVLPRQFPLRGHPRRRRHRGSRRDAFVHRPQRLDGALRPHRRPQRLYAGAAPFRAAPGCDDQTQRRGQQDDRRRRDGGLSDPGRRGGCGARHAGGGGGAQPRPPAPRLHPQDRHSSRCGDRGYAKRPPRLLWSDRKHRLA